MPFDSTLVIFLNLSLLTEIVILLDVSFVIATLVGLVAAGVTLPVSFRFGLYIVFPAVFFVADGLFLLNCSGSRKQIAGKSPRRLQTLKGCKKVFESAFAFQ